MLDFLHGINSIMKKWQSIQLHFCSNAINILAQQQSNLFLSLVLTMDRNEPILFKKILLELGHDQLNRESTNDAIGNLGMLWVYLKTDFHLW